MVKINGKETDCSGMTISAYLLSANFESNRVAVELNGNIVPKIEYSQIQLHDDDEAEIVSFVGGG